MADPSDYDEWYAKDVKDMLTSIHTKLEDPMTMSFCHDVLDRLEKMENAIKRFDHHQRTIMVGWNSFLEHAGMQLNHLFRGRVPAPILRKLLEASFRDEPKHATTPDK